MNELETLLKKAIRDVPDFPKDGIVFKDVSTLFQDPVLCNGLLARFKKEAQLLNPDLIVGIDSRGFVFGAALAFALGVPFVMARKKGKLPYDKVSEEYELEYGTDEIEMHVDAIKKRQKVLIHDDLLATGGTAECVAKLVTKLGAEVAGFSFIVNLEFLEGVKKLNPYSSNLFAAAAYD